MLNKETLRKIRENIHRYSLESNDYSDYILSEFNKKNLTAENNHLIERIDPSLSKVTGFMIDIMNTDPYQYYYVYQTREKQFGYLNKGKYLRWKASCFNLDLRYKIGYRLEWEKAIRKSNYYKKYFNKKGDFAPTDKQPINKDTKYYLAEKLRKQIYIELKPIGDGHSLENWVTAYMARFDQGNSSSEYSNTSCMHENMEGVARMMRTYEAISDGGKNLEIWGAFIEENILIGRFKVWKKDGTNYIDRIYCRQEYTTEILNQKRKIKNAIWYTTSGERTNMFNNLAFVVDSKNFHHDSSYCYFDNLMWFSEQNGKVIITNTDNPTVVERNIIIKEGINPDNLKFTPIQSVASNKRIFFECSACHTRVLSGFLNSSYQTGDPNVLCNTCKNKYRKVKIQEFENNNFKDTQYKTIIRKDVYYTNNLGETDLKTFLLKTLISPSYKISDTTKQLLEFRLKENYPEEYEKYSKKIEEDKKK